MLQITDAQFRQLSDEALSSFVQELAAHVAIASPRLAATLSWTERETLAHAVIEMADQVGFTLRGPIRLLLDLRLRFGDGVLNDPLHGWAHDALDSIEAEREMARAEALHRAICDTMDAVHGPEGAWTHRALARLLDWANPSPEVFEGDWPDLGFELMQRLHPEKANFSGEAALWALCNCAKSEAEKIGWTGARERVLLLALMYAFGAGCGTDPNYPWIQRTLKDEKIAEAESRATRLERKAITWLKHVVADNLAIAKQDLIR